MMPLLSRRMMFEWLPVLIGFVGLYASSFHIFFTQVWNRDDTAHGPMILALSLWLMYRKRSEMLAVARDNTSSPVAWLLLAFGLLLFIVGRSQQILALEFSSLITVMAAILLLKLGFASLRVYWFPFFFLLFMIPLPSSLVALLTMPMKMAVSYVSEHLLFWAGYPIARSGVILQIGQYQLLVADACAGLQTLLALESLGLLYLNVVRHTSTIRNIGLALLIVPISFTANVLRVIALTLITYYWGDAAGQGFLHGFAGMVLFISALILIISVDSLLQWLVSWRQRSAHRNQ
ncbi:exosortase B [Janthinobacterium sp.]|uniref:exosortase B n=1 Tax=Janthinobacterium sp. TaxID=1871054 RepID=UPI0028985D1B|nr:exosortase B [Janthinobacterium sp.]